MAEPLPFIRPRPIAPAPGQFIETEAAQDFLDALTRAHAFGSAGERFALIAAAPGMGKSMAVQHYRRTVGRVLVIRAVDGEGGVWNLTNALCAALEIEEPNSRRLYAERGRIAEAIGCERMLVVDEAQYLVQRNPRGRDDWDAFEWLRGMAEDHMLSLAFCGNLALREVEQALPSLWRRLKPRVIKTRPARADRLAIAAQWGITQPDLVEVLLAATGRTGGCLADIADVGKELQDVTDGDIPTKDHLLAALENLGLQPIMGGK